MGVGEISIIDELLVSVLLYSKDLAQNYNLPDFYTIVKESAWTLEKFLEFVNMVSVDLNGDGQMDENDMWGYLCELRSLDHFYFGSGEKMTHYNDQGELYIDMLGERSINVIQKVSDMMLENSAVGSWGMGATAIYEIFSATKALFQSTSMRPVTQLRDMDMEYGILPFPKFDESQDNYYTSQNPSLCPSVVIPITVKDKTMSAVVVQALAYYGEKFLSPVIYNTFLQEKIARDLESQNMLDILYSNRSWDWGFANDSGGLYWFLGNEIIAAKNKNFISAYESISSMIDIDLKNVLAFYYN